MTDRWCTLPGWKTAHLVEEWGSLGAITLWGTACQRSYRTPDHEYDDEPITAPSDMPHCKSCVAATERQARLLATLTAHYAEGANP